MMQSGQPRMNKLPQIGNGLGGIHALSGSTEYLIKDPEYWIGDKSGTSRQYRLKPRCVPHRRSRIYSAAAYILMRQVDRYALLTARKQGQGNLEQA